MKEENEKTVKNLLFVSNLPQRFLDQVSFAENLILKSSDKFRIFFYISPAVSEKYNTYLQEFNFKIINNIDTESTKKTSFIDFIKLKIINKLLNSIFIKFGFVLKYRPFDKYQRRIEANYLKDLNKKYISIIEIFNKNNFNLVFINGDRHLGVEPVFLKICSELKIPTLIPYMTFLTEPESLAEGKKNYGLKRSVFISDYFLSSEMKFKKQKFNNKFYYPHYIANSLFKFGTLSEFPWVIGRGKSDYLCLPNLYLKKYYIKKGVKVEKIKVIGDVAYDLLYKNYNSKFKILNNTLKKYNLMSKKIVIVALPQLAEHGILPWNKHWEEVDFLLSSIDKLNCNIIISLHPKMNRKSYLFLEKKYNCLISEERLLNILPIADMFIATYSSTVLWSVLCGIKTLVVDFYCLNHRIFDFLESVKIATNKQTFVDLLKKIELQEVDFASDWESLSRDQVFDGKTIERYVDLIGQVAKK